MFKKLRIVVLVLLIGLVACNSKSRQTNSDEDLEVTVDTSVATLKLTDNTEEDVIFYNLLYPIDMISVFDQKENYYNSNLLNPLNNISNYNQSSQMALALGIYGADLSYLQLFNQSQQALSYFSCIKQLSSDLGISVDYMNESALRADKYSDNIDTLVSIARNTYRLCDNYLKENNQGDLAVLILLGGWVESMNAAVKLYRSPNNRLACKIISQKYSLTSLLNLLNSVPSNATIEKNMGSLVDILNEFDRLQNAYLSDNLKIDTVEKTITFMLDATTLVQPEDLNDLKKMIVALREDIIQ